MIINHNLGASNAIRQMGVNQTNANKSMEKLSSGLKINKAGDDAAGLAISEKMRGQIRGLDQASSNAQDGISLIQTAEGALSETTSILQRMRELAVQGSNDTNTTDDRTQIQKEMNQLTSEISRIGNNTEFNTQKLLKGEATAGNGTVSNVTSVAGNKESIDAKSNLTVDDLIITAKNNGSEFNGYTLTVKDDTSEGVTVDKDKKTITITLDINGTSGTDISTFNADDLDFTFSGNAGTATTGTTGKTNGGSKAVAAQIGSTKFTLSTSLKSGDTLEVGGKTITSYADDEARKAANNGAGDAYGVLETQTVNEQAEAIRKMTFDTGVKATGAGSEIILTQEVAGTGDVTGPVVTNRAGETNTSFTFQIGANEGQQFTATISDMRSAALGLAGTGAQFITGLENDLSDVSENGEHALDISTADAATKAITIIDKATSTVSAERAKLGAYSNRLEHTIANLGTSSENLTSAESRIRDVNMAKEMSTFSKNNILSQAAQAMISQANQQPQQVLQLLR